MRSRGRCTYVSLHFFMGIHHYYTLHRLSVQIEVPSRGISKKKLNKQTNKQKKKQKQKPKKNQKKKKKTKNKNKKTNKQTKTKKTKKRSVAYMNLYDFFLIFQTSAFYNIFKNEEYFCDFFFFDIYWFLKAYRFRVIMIAS